VWIVDRIRAREGRALATRASAEVAQAVTERFPDAVYHPATHMLVVGGAAPPSGRGTVLVVSAGTADLNAAPEPRDCRRLAVEHSELLKDVYQAAQEVARAQKPWPERGGEEAPELGAGSRQG
jgi:NCAIR mutase (PurE)-related protein